jgi:hypothetical protein
MMERKLLRVRVERLRVRVVELVRLEGEAVRQRAQPVLGALVRSSAERLRPPHEAGQQVV